jgi:cytoskeletal protein RodZ
MTTIDTIDANNTPLTFGALLQQARQAASLSREDIAAKLRLSEKIIIMMEKDRYPSTLHPTFIRGYLNAYGRLLNLPEPEIKKAIECVKPRAAKHETFVSLKSLEEPTNKYKAMRFFTYIIFFSLLGLIGFWWQAQQSTNSSMLADRQDYNENQTIHLDNDPLTMAHHSSNKIAEGFAGNHEQNQLTLADSSPESIDKTSDDQDLANQLRS